MFTSATATVASSSCVSYNAQLSSATATDLLNAATVAGAGIMLPTAPSGREWYYQFRIRSGSSYLLAATSKILHSVYYSQAY
ncbi:hypothetical protein EV368DRAFT_82822 [Lentinula lateritia]|uniref:Uncharacterized protein n=1 Tax=Lentinula aff. lateritia TaxID=2804960 RepID=A0ACC1TRI8_9AGAR|nr:hypothetical protein F5876DRAFT_79806 [Lentinula aff. lateritia]KAJ3852143.1 hypothetical protein EV368DRAFT_82822 [Lentinula lateritia]